MVVLAAFCFTTPAVAFKLGPHSQILQSSIGQRIGQRTFNDILGTLESGQGNLGSDLHQTDTYRHFDNAPDRQAVCDRATAAWARFYVEIRDSVQPQHAPEYDQIGGIRNARSAFGALTHSLQDFYAHSNWVELYVASGQRPPLALALFPNCVAQSLPTGLHTGYFDLYYGLGGCPNSPLNDAWIPPPGFDFCHETLNKDSDQTRHGRELIPGTATTFHARAAQLARAHTDALFNTILATLQADWKTKFPQVRPDCLVQHVMVVDVTRPCRFARLKFINDSHNGGTRLADGTVVVRDAAGATVASKSVSKGSWPFPVIDVPTCLPGLTVQWQFYVDDSMITPTARQVSGTSEVSGAGCDADIHVIPENLLTYLVRFTNADTEINGFTNVTVTVNSGQQFVSAGPIPVGITTWIDLGPCNTVANLDFIFKYIDPTDNMTSRTASPDPPPHSANAGCLDQFSFDLGGQIYGP
jgi:hypothetical protein